MRTLDGFADAVQDWLDALAKEQPELLDKITEALVASGRSAEAQQATLAIQKPLEWFFS